MQLGDASQHWKHLEQRVEVLWRPALRVLARRARQEPPELVDQLVASLERNVGAHVAAARQRHRACRQRRDGYREALAQAGVTPEPQWLVESAPTRLEAARQVGALFVRDPAPTAAVCYNDAVALGLVAGLTARGRRAGEDFAVVGFDDIPEAAVSAPPLSTIAADPRARGRPAAALVLHRLQHPDAAPARTVAPARLVVRESSGAAVAGSP